MFKFYKNHKKEIIIAGILLGVVFSVFWPILIGGQVIVGKWNIFDHYPRLAFLQRALTNHESLIWTENFLGGFPIYLGAWGEHVNPIFLFLLNFFSYISVTHWWTFINMFLAALLTYFFLRMLLLSRLASLFGALIYSFNQWSLFYSSPSFLGNIFPLIPLVFISILKIAQNNKKYFFWLLLALSLVWLSGLADAALYVTLAGFAFAFYLDIKAWKQTRKIRKIRVAGLFVFALFIASFLVSPRLIPIVDSLKGSVRSGGPAQSSSYLQSFEDNGYIGPTTLIKFIFPYFNVPFSDFIPMLNGADTLTFFYMGLFPLIFLAIFFFDFKNNINLGKFTKFFAVLFAVTLAMVLKYVPLFWLLHKLPIFNLFGGGGKFTFLTLFSLAVLLGVSFDNIYNFKNNSRFQIFFRWLKVAMILFVILLILGNLFLYFGKDKIINYAHDYFIKHLYAQDTRQKSLEHYDGLISQTFNGFAYNFSFSNWHYIVSLLVIFSSFAVFYRFGKNKLRIINFRKIVIIITIATFVVMWQSFFDFLPQKVLTDKPADIEFLLNQQKNSQPFRTFRFWGGLSKYSEMKFDQNNLTDKTLLEMSLLAPNYSLLYGVDFIGGHENIMSGRHSRLVAFIGSEYAPKNQTWISDQKISFQEKFTRFESSQNRHLLSMLNVRYVVTSFEFNYPWKKVFENKITSANIPVYVYENPDYLPRVYFADQVTFTKDEEQSFQTILNDSDFKKNTVIECADCAQLVGSNSSDKITIKEQEGGHLKVKTVNKNPRWFIYSESNLPNWEITINGQPTKAYTANYLFQAIYVPAGTNEIIFNYPGVIKQTEYSISHLWSQFFKRF